LEEVGGAGVVSRSATSDALRLLDLPMTAKMSSELLRWPGASDLLRLHR
jgi:hypothetical protein